MCFPLEDESDDSLSSDNESEIDIEKDLKQWATECNIALSSLSYLLKILKKHSCFTHFPADGRTLLKTNRSSVCSIMGDGEFAYFGVKQILSESGFSPPFSLSINVDGLPLYKSSTKQFWPILGSLNDSPPFVIAIYCGNSKPNIQDFLRDFITEMKSLNSTVRLSSINCDSPARAYLKCIKSPNGYSSCDKCTVQGSHDRHVLYISTNLNVIFEMMLRFEISWMKIITKALARSRNSPLTWCTHFLMTICILCAWV